MSAKSLVELVKDLPNAMPMKYTTASLMTNILRCSWRTCLEQDGS